MKNVLIASTYYERHHSLKDNDLYFTYNKIWFKLQNQFIKKNTINYDFAVYLNTIKNKDLFKKSIIIGENNELDVDSRLSHRRGLKASIQYFREHQKKYDAFCILDSDCFPIRKNWLIDIKQELKNKKLKFAAVMRTENGELFPHPCGIIIPSEFIQENLFNFPETFKNAPKKVVDGTKNFITGEVINDTGTNMTFWDKSGKMQGYPLVRSNAINVHPLYSGIYGDIFYHNGFGSRFKKNTNEIYKTKFYWDLHRQFNQDFSIFFNLIKKSPDYFIAKLRGENLKLDNVKNNDVKVPLFNP